MFITSCRGTTATTTVEDLSLKESVDSLNRELTSLKKDLNLTKTTAVNKFNQMEYFIEHDKCFISYGICLGEGKDKKACWNKHEQCVILVYRKWKDILQ